MLKWRTELQIFVIGSVIGDRYCEEELLESEDITRNGFASLLPDINPIEHVWDALGRRIAALLHHPENTQQLKQMLIEETGTPTGRKCCTSCCHIHPTLHRSTVIAPDPHAGTKATKGMTVRVGHRGTRLRHHGEIPSRTVSGVLQTKGMVQAGDFSNDHIENESQEISTRTKCSSKAM
ncbi:transposable element Tcb2 transposase [Trichonephila clavipes]|nr:transposable element Tcb2 transposase [Trichonephila clavipes]